VVRVRGSAVGLGWGYGRFNTEVAEVGTQRAQREEGVGYACRLEAGATTEERKKKANNEVRCPPKMIRTAKNTGRSACATRLLGGLGLYLVEGEG
jgi:hypothetical protein